MINDVYLKKKLFHGIILHIVIKNRTNHIFMCADGWCKGAGLGMEQEVSEHVKRHFDEFYEANPFLELLGVRVTSYERGRVRLDMDVKHEHTNVHHIAHGGVAATLVDTAMGVACFTCDKGVVTLEMNLSFIRPVYEGVAYAVGEVVHDGKRTMVCEGSVYGADGELCLKARGTFFVVRNFMENPGD